MEALPSLLDVLASVYNDLSPSNSAVVAMNTLRSFEENPDDKSHFILNK